MWFITCLSYYRIHHIAYTGKFWLVWYIFQVHYAKCAGEIIVCMWNKKFLWLTNVLTKLIKIIVFWDILACILIHYTPTFWRDQLSPCQEFWYRSTRIHGITSQKTIVFNGCVAACLSLSWKGAISHFYPHHSFCPCILTQLLLVECIL